MPNQVRTPRKRPKAASQGTLAFRSWGGPRKGAGRRPASGKPRVPHHARAKLVARIPLLVTFRFVVSGLRRESVHEALRSVLRTIADEKLGFRVLAYSLLGNHLHVIVEGDSVPALRRGLRALPIRLALRINLALGRKGKLFEERHHRHALGTPREVRNAYAYVLLNWRKHRYESTGDAGPDVLDPYSSASSFDGWSRKIIPSTEHVVSQATTWLAKAGWRRRGLIDPAEVPGRKRG